MISRKQILTVGVLAVVLHAGTWTGAIAASPPGTSFENAFGALFMERAARLLKCVGGVQNPASTEVLFIGAPAPALRVNESRRRDLNDAAMRTINNTGVYRAVPAEPTGALAGLLRGSAGNVQLQKTLASLYKAPVIAKFRLRRPALDIVQVQVDLLGRKPDGSYTCTTTASLYVDADTLRSRAAPPQDRDLVRLEGAFRDGMLRILPQLRKADHVTVTGSVMLPGDCRLKSGVVENFAATFFALKREQNFAAELSAEWPGFSFGTNTTADPKGHQLTVTIFDADEASRIVRVELRIARATEVLDLTTQRVVVDGDSVEGCSEPRPEPAVVVATTEGEPEAGPEEVKPHKAEPGAEEPQDAKGEVEPAATTAMQGLTMGREDPSLVFYSDKSVYAPNERMKLFVQPPRDCRLTLINVDDEGRSCLLFPHEAFAANDVVIASGQTFRYPPRGSMRAPSGRFQKFVALCNATEAAKAAETRDTTVIGCSRGRSDESYRRSVLETVMIDPEDDDDDDGSSAATARQPDILRRSIVVRIGQ